MVRKGQVKETFINYCTTSEGQFGKKVKGIHFDNGGEYEALKFYLQEKGIARGMPAPYTPQSNGIAEKTNRTLAEMIRKMLW